MGKRIFCLLLILLLVFLTVACDAVRENPAATEEATYSENVQVFVDVSSYGYYTDQEYLPNEIQQSLDIFGSPMWLKPSLQTEIYTNIPKPENNAKGTDPVALVLQELDLENYRGSYGWKDTETGWGVSAAYREVAGMLTDELVKVYIDESGNLCQYETVNLGRYDGLNLAPRYLESARLHFDDAIENHLGTVIREQYNARQHNAPSAYSLLMDTEGRLLLCTTGVLEKNAGTVELYAVLKTGNLYE